MSAMTSVFDAGELELIRASLRHVLETNAPQAVPRALVDAGWTDLVAADPATAVTVLADEAGRTRSPAPVLDVAVLWAAGIDDIAGTAVIAGGLVLAGAERATRFVNLTDDALRLVDADAVTLRPGGGFDPASGLSLARLDADGEMIGDADLALAAVDAGRRAIASQAAGAAEQMLTDTIAYVTQRHQYGQAIGSFQSVKHRLADVQVAVVAAKAATRAAWESADGRDGTTLAIAAKCLAGRAQQLASTHCFQVHGGIAFTVEHGFQQWVRRGLLLDALLGSTDQLQHQLGQRLLTTKQVPRQPALRA